MEFHTKLTHFHILIHLFTVDCPMCHYIRITVNHLSCSATNNLRQDLNVSNNIVLDFQSSLEIIISTLKYLRSQWFYVLSFLHASIYKTCLVLEKDIPESSCICIIINYIFYLFFSLKVKSTMK